jgi:hypothetical protein
MINNNVEFSRDPNDHMYVATIKIVNKQINGGEKKETTEGKNDSHQVKLTNFTNNGMKINEKPSFGLDLSPLSKSSGTKKRA